MRILIVEDDEIIARNIKEVLGTLGFAVDVAGNGESGLEKIEIEEYDCVILDWMLPDIDGVEVLEKIRNNGNNSPVLLLTAKSQLADKVRGLKTGADDYLTKPFAMEELIERVKAMMRRSNGKTKSPVLTIGDLKIDTNTWEVTRNKKKITLAPKEYQVLEFLARNKDKICERTEILSHVWGEDIDPFSNTVDVHIRYLRKKIDEGYENKLIRTVKGKGYMVCAD